MPEIKIACVALGLMAAATYLTRIAGVWLVGRTRAPERLERLFMHLSGSVLAALTVTSMAKPDPALLFGVTGGLGAMLATRKPLVSMLIAVVTTALLRI